MFLFFFQLSSHFFSHLFINMSAASTWCDYVKSEMKNKPKDVAPKEFMKVIASQWKRLDQTLKVKGKQTKRKYLSTEDPFSATAAAAQSGGKQDIEGETADQAADQTTASTATPIRKRRADPFEALATQLLSQGNSTKGRVTIKCNKRAKHTLIGCLHEGRQLISEGKLTPMQAMELGASLPFRYLVSQ